jgi:thioesterase domain-containing protein/acyl carrier protein
MSTPTPEQSAVHSAADIRSWIVNELARSMKVDPSTIDPAAPLHSIGADSLAAIGMTGGLAAWLYRDLPATLMWDYPSIDAIAQALADSPAAAPLPPDVIAMQPLGERAPLFCFPGMGGHPVTFAALAEQLAPDTPCYGLTVPGLHGEQEPFTKLQDIASAVLKNIRLVQPRGPYQFAGYSFGGLLAYETAQQCIAAGETVSVLAIFDAFTHEGRKLRPRWQRWILHALHLTVRPGRRAYLDERIKQWRRGRKPATGQGSSAADTHEAQAKRADHFSQNNRRAAVAYRPQPYPGKIVLFQATDRAMHNIYYRIDPTHGWRTLASNGMETVVLPGTHATLLNANNAATAAQALRPHLLATVAQ